MRKCWMSFRDLDFLRWFKPLGGVGQYSNEGAGHTSHYISPTTFKNVWPEEDTEHALNERLLQNGKGKPFSDPMKKTNPPTLANFHKIKKGGDQKQ